MKIRRMAAVALAVLMVMSVTVFAAYRSGDRGEKVREIQTRLKRWGYYTGNIDGIYGKKTVAAVKYFQRQNGLTVDGVCGEQTLAALGISGGSQAGDNDLYLLARMIAAEARGEPYVGQVAVGAVILNRVRHPSFPNSIAGVIYQPRAFSAIDDGQWQKTPITDSARRAAQDALNGWDPTGGAIYYYNPAKTTSKWIYSRPVVTTIGAHVFAK
ncbi:MAG: spore cortex-lytic enzyme [Clostridia bacterium]|nr:spore cortex-lytic enzyme [Clostridia bacterium]